MYKLGQSVSKKLQDIQTRNAHNNRSRMLKFENLNTIVGYTFHNGRFIVYKCEDSLVKTYFHIRDMQTPFTQAIELRKEANPVYVLENTFNKTMVYCDLNVIKDKTLFLKKLETLIDISVVWE